MFVGALIDIIMILGEHLKSNGTSFQGTVWTKESLNVGARGVHTTYCFCDFSLRVAL